MSQETVKKTNKVGLQQALQKQKVATQRWNVSQTAVATEIKAVSLDCPLSSRTQPDLCRYQLHGSVSIRCQFSHFQTGVPQQYQIACCSTIL